MPDKRIGLFEVQLDEVKVNRYQLLRAVLLRLRLQRKQLDSNIGTSQISRPRTDHNERCGDDVVATIHSAHGMPEQFKFPDRLERGA
jgi:hypothetical protein